MQRFSIDGLFRFLRMVWRPVGRPDDKGVQKRIHIKDAWNMAFFDVDSIAGMAMEADANGIISSMPVTACKNCPLHDREYGWCMHPMTSSKPIKKDAPNVPEWCELLNDDFTIYHCDEAMAKK